MTTSDTGPTGPYPGLADGLRAATESAAQLWRAGADALAAQADAIAQLPIPDPAAGIDRYFELLRQATEANQLLAGQWAAAVRSMTELLTGSAASAGSAGSADAAGDRPGTALVPATSNDVVPTGPPASAAPAARPAAAVAVGAGAVSRAARAGPPKTRPRRARPATDSADSDPRTAYVRMGKAAVSALLAERGLPRSGTLAQLVNRLVEAEAAD